MLGSKLSVHAMSNINVNEEGDIKNEIFQNCKTLPSQHLLTINEGLTEVLALEHHQS